MTAIATIPSAVFVGDPNSVFVARTRDALSMRGVPVVVISTQEADINWPIGRILKKICTMYKRFTHIKKEIKKLPRESTAVVHFLSVDVFWLIPLLKRHFIKVVGIAYGSDVLRRKPSRDWLLAHGLKKLDQIVATNYNVLNKLLADFSFLHLTEHSIIRFGLPVFDKLDELSQITPQDARARLGYEPDKALVSLGYSASLGQRQVELIEHFATYSDRFQHVNFLVPIQYGASEVCDRVTEACDRANSGSAHPNFQVLTEFHGPEESALLRRATTVLINHSVSDAFSGTVQEVVYAGSLVLAYSKLPYRTMPGFGTAIRVYSQLSEVVSQLSKENIEYWMNHAQTSFKVTKKELREISSWEAVIGDWETLVSRKPQ